ncbi:MAG: hypothetical protein ACK5KR_07855 [Breznakia sp.]
MSYNEIKSYLVYPLSKTENRQKQLLDQSKPYDPNPKVITYEIQTQVYHNLQYYIDHEDMGLMQMVSAI